MSPYLLLYLSVSANELTIFAILEQITAHAELMATTFYQCQLLAKWCIPLNKQKHAKHILIVEKLKYIFR
ncbi:hypothetical protein T4A_11280 [Trichinella pseudospiralis]|uniref:Uncharacterized protein n=1 Tax=Trichinella pseudospiralis TaxID=6337 RepID=A0A0V1ESU2_TRIPS|nr:hypothetical protein T4A_11280 [Trichinella pseudospiralis]